MTTATSITTYCAFCGLPMIEAVTGDGRRVLLDPRVRVYSIAGQKASGDKLALLTADSAVEHECRGKK